MGAPVVHWEITSRNAKQLQGFFSDLFDWKVDTNNPMGYGLIDTQAERGIPGGIGEPREGDGWVTFYVAVDDLQTYLERAEALGGKILMRPTEVPGNVVLAMIAGPDGHPIGLTKAS